MEEHNLLEITAVLVSCRPECAPATLTSILFSTRRIACVKLIDDSTDQALIGSGYIRQFIAAFQDAGIHIEVKANEHGRPLVQPRCQYSLEAETELVLWLDDDLIFPPDLISHVWNLLNSHPDKSYAAPAIFTPANLQNLPDFNPVYQPPGYIEQFRREHSDRPVCAQWHRTLEPNVLAVDMAMGCFLLFKRQEDVLLGLIGENPSVHDDRLFTGRMGKGVVDTGVFAYHLTFPDQRRPWPDVQ